MNGKVSIADHIVNRFINWKLTANGEKVTFNEDDVPHSYTFGRNVCGDYIRMNNENYIISNVENLYSFLKKNEIK